MLGMALIENPTMKELAVGTTSRQRRRRTMKKVNISTKLLKDNKHNMYAYLLSDIICSKHHPKISEGFGVFFSVLRLDQPVTLGSTYTT